MATAKSQTIIKLCVELRSDLSFSSRVVLCITHLVLTTRCHKTTITVAARSKAWVCGRSLSVIVGSSPAGSMNVCLLWLLCVVKWRCLRRADHSSRGFLPSCGVRCEGCCSSNTAHTEHIEYAAAPRTSNLLQHQDDTPHCCNHSLTLLKMGKWLPETCWTASNINKIRLFFSNYELNAQFLYSSTICMLHYDPQHVSSSTLLILRRANCITTASGIFTLCKQPYSMPV